jgi:hypothetical protein
MHFFANHLSNSHYIDDTLVCYGSAASRPDADQGDQIGRIFAYWVIV